MSRPRIVVFAYSDVGHACLKLLLDRGAQVVAVYTHDDDPAEQRWFPSVAELARAQRIPVYVDEPRVENGGIERLRALAPDILLSFYYRSLLPAPVLALAPLGAFNMHGSLLPKYRGRAPVNWAVLHGETETGATLHVMEAKADAGDIVDAEAVPIGPDDSAAEVQARVRDAAVTVLARQLEQLEAGTAPRRPQNEAAASRFGRRRPADGAIDWQRPAGEIHNLVRAVTHPYPGAFTDAFVARTYVWRSRVAELSDSSGTPARLLAANGKLYATCGDGRCLEILRAQIDGEEETDGGSLAPRLVQRHSRQRSMR
jgi:methionyl-tRNA formyltransferase